MWKIHVLTYLYVYISYLIFAIFLLTKCKIVWFYLLYLFCWYIIFDRISFSDFYLRAFDRRKFIFLVFVKYDQVMKIFWYRLFFSNKKNYDLESLFLFYIWTKIKCNSRKLNINLKSSWRVEIGFKVFVLKIKKKTKLWRMMLSTSRFSPKLKAIRLIEQINFLLIVSLTVWIV